ncbi:MAG: ATP-binding cassette domain-containing protein [Spirochaetaceae bacterium]|jgi:ATP-binding cassette subfamily B protein|nr:ATP-binding cassette domain-containing protein [Spirochaetaceae bacterium]
MEENYSLSVYKIIFPYMRRYRLRYTVGFFCLLVVDGAQVLIPQIMRRAVDLVSGGSFILRDVMVLALAMVGGMAVISLGRFLWRYFIYGSARRIEAEIRENIFDHLLVLSWDFYQKNKIGDLMARSTNDLGQVRNAIGMGLVTMVDGTVMALAILVIIFVQDAGAAGLAVIPLVPITLLILLSSKMTGRLFERANRAWSDMSDTAQETFAGIRVVKSFVKEWWFTQRFTRDNDSYRKVNMSLTRVFGIFFPLVNFLAQISTVILIAVGGRRVVLGLMSAGELVSLFSYIQMLIWPLMGAGFMVNMIRRGAVSLGRINEILCAESSIKNPAEARRPLFEQALSPGMPKDNAGENAIEIRGLSFAWEQGKPVLADIDLSVADGVMLGILGPTGSGKSTLIKILTRMADPPEDTVRIYGIPSASWNLEELRGIFGVAPQDSYLFSDSIKNNIGYGLSASGENSDTVAAGDDGHEDDAGKGDLFKNRRAQNRRRWFFGRSPAQPRVSGTDASPSDIVDQSHLIAKAARFSAIDQDLPQFSRGFDTLIGERGLTLSGGQ